MPFPGRTPHVLVVDDDENHRLISTTTLQRMRGRRRFHLDEARDGREALHKLRRLFRHIDPILVLCDYQMPNMGGLELLRSVRVAQGPTPVWFVMFTSMEKGADEAECLRSGADQFVIKPVQLEQFRSRVEDTVRGWLESLGPAPGSP